MIMECWTVLQCPRIATSGVSGTSRRVCIVELGGSPSSSEEAEDADEESLEDSMVSPAGSVSGSATAEGGSCDMGAMVN